jgi:hypothetical protein
MEMMHEANNKARMHVHEVGMRKLNAWCISTCIVHVDMHENDYGMIVH